MDEYDDLSWFLFVFWLVFFAVAMFLVIHPSEPVIQTIQQVPR